MIEKAVQTRDIKNIRSHAQKFLASLLRYIEGRDIVPEMTLEDAEFYYGVLKQKLHKSMKPKGAVAEKKAGIP